MILKDVGFEICQSIRSTFPRSRQIIAEILADCSEEERAKVAGGNATRIYRLS